MSNPMSQYDQAHAYKISDNSHFQVGAEMPSNQLFWCSVGASKRNTTVQLLMHIYLVLVLTSTK